MPMLPERDMNELIEVPVLDFDAGDVVGANRIMNAIASIAGAATDPREAMMAIERIRGILPPELPWVSRTELTRLTLETLDVTWPNHGYPEAGSPGWTVQATARIP